MAGAVRDERADGLRRCFHAAYGTPVLPVRVEEIAEDLQGLAVGERKDLAVSGVLLPAERRIWLKASEVPARGRFTLAPCGRPLDL
jgi:hypothetical protein